MRAAHGVIAETGQGARSGWGRQVLTFIRVVIALSGLIACGAALAQGYPNKPIRIVVPYAAGGGTDQLARLVGQQLSERLQQPVIIDNRPGASTFIGAEAVARAPADGYTLLTSAASTFSINASLYPKLPYDPVTDFSPISLLGRFPLMLVVTRDHPAHSLAEFVRMASVRPGSIDYASAGIGSTHHLAMELFMQRTGIQLTHVPYKGAGPALQDLLSARVPGMFLDVAVARESLRAGSIRALGVASAERFSDFPEVPTIAESGYAGFEASAWNGIVAPRATPTAIITRLNQVIGDALRSESLRTKMLAAGIDPAPTSPQAFAAYIQTETDKWGAVVHQGHITVEQPK